MVRLRDEEEIGAIGTDDHEENLAIGRLGDLAIFFMIWLFHDWDANLPIKSPNRQIAKSRNFHFTVEPFDGQLDRSRQQLRCDTMEVFLRESGAIDVALRLIRVMAGGQS